jgi:flagellar biosynthesis chaperone FliJ
MLKALTTLIKINKALLDEKRKQLGLLLDKKQKFIEEIKRIEEEIKSEGEKLPETKEEFRPSYINFVFGCRIKEEMIFNELDKLNPLINKITDEISEVFSEMKKYEILKEAKQDEILKEIARKNQIEIDEIAIMNHAKQGT